MPTEEFLSTHWQNSPLFMPKALGELPPVLTPDELAWLATQADVESRLVFTEPTNDEALYRVESGPFDVEILSSLPDRDWTLLIQDVDKHLPDFADWFARIPFIPGWRIDDLMISFAAPGGSVGPHLDNYDVFLCQGTGEREWHLADAQQAAISNSSDQLALLRPFADPAPRRAQSGDVLYLPPGTPHWGIANTACMTYSIGMRAPALGELRLGFEREFPDERNPFPAKENENSLFYRDPDLGTDESLPGQISTQAVSRCRQLVEIGTSIDERMLAITLGCVVTDLKAWLAPDTPSASELDDILCNREKHSILPVHGMARMAWFVGAEELVVFSNGHARAVSPTCLSLIQELCHTRQLDRECLHEPEEKALFEWLLNMGTFDLR
jgi:50S ribosomal protein L16 3-hydroxylase